MIFLVKKMLKRATDLSSVFHTCCRVYSQPVCYKSTYAKLGLPEPPKAPTSGYFLYVKDHLGKLKQQHTELQNTDLIKRLSNEWNTLPEKVKVPYVEKGKKNIEEYQEQYKKYIGQLTQEQRQRLASAKQMRKAEIQERTLKRARTQLVRALKKMGMPNKPLSSFFVFLEEKKKEEQSSSKPQVMRKLTDRLLKRPPETKEKPSPKERVSKAAEEWNKMTDEEKQPYVRKSAILGQQYQRDLMGWKTVADKMGLPDPTKRNIDALTKDEIQQLLGRLPKV